MVSSKIFLVVLVASGLFALTVGENMWAKRAAQIDDEITEETKNLKQYLTTIDCSNLAIEECLDGDSHLQEGITKVVAGLSAQTELEAIAEKKAKTANDLVRIKLEKLEESNRRLKVALGNYPIRTRQMAVVIIEQTNALINELKPLI